MPPSILAHNWHLGLKHMDQLWLGRILKVEPLNMRYEPFADEHHAPFYRLSGELITKQEQWGLILPQSGFDEFSDMYLDRFGSLAKWKDRAVIVCKRDGKVDRLLPAN
jgi:hypothetical protein